MYLADYSYEHPYPCRQAFKDAYERSTDKVWKHREVVQDIRNKKRLASFNLKKRIGL